MSTVEAVRKVNEAVLKIKIDPSGFIRGMHDMGHVVQNMSADFAGRPRPPKEPYPKRYSRMTAREYRAARRAYARAMQAHKRNLRTWQPDRRTQLAALMMFAEAAQRAKSSNVHDAPRPD